MDKLPWLFLIGCLSLHDHTVYLDIQKNPDPETEALFAQRNMTHMHLTLPVDNGGVINCQRSQF